MKPGSLAACLAILACVIVLAVAGRVVDADGTVAKKAPAGSGDSAPAPRSTTPVPPSVPDPHAILPAQRIDVQRNGAGAGHVRVAVGIPLPPGALRDPRRVRILAADGTEIPADVQATLRWFAGDGSVRAVRAQFEVDLAKDKTTYYFALGTTRIRDLPPAPYAPTMAPGEQGLAVPAALATLTPEWLCASRIAGPQLPAAHDEAYARYVDGQFRWARKLPVDDPTAWLFDRPSTLFKAYLRTGRLDYLQAADLSYRYYMKFIRHDGAPESPDCAGGWTRNDKPCDVKYVYIEPILLAVALTGNDATTDAKTVRNMAELWANGGWNGAPGPYKSPSGYFTERLAGLGLLEIVNAYELTGEHRYLDQVGARVGWLDAHQRSNPDGLGDDGAWRNSWNVHEGNGQDPATEVRGASPWMSENIIDGLWHAWLVTGDRRIPPMVTGFGQYLEKYGWIKPAQLLPGHDWRNPCSGSDGQIAWYWSSSQADVKALAAIEESDGWYSDAHTVEIGLPVAAAYYFERDPTRSAALKRRLDALTSSYSPRCAAVSDTLRRFNWNNRGAGVVQWLSHQPPGSGQPGGITAHAH